MGYFVTFLVIDLVVWFFIFRFFLFAKPSAPPKPPKGDSDDPDGGLTLSDVPKLDLPPGVTLPVEDLELVEA
ncbi:MAG: hypothetical protein AAGA85_12640 [Bacteroidota bacterium]